MKKTMTPEARAALAFLRADLAAMDVERTNLIREIARIEKKYGSSPFSGGTSAPSESESAKPMSNAEVPGSRKYRKNAKGEPSNASLVAKAGAAQSGVFSMVELRSYLDAHHRERSAKLTNDDLSKQIYILTKRGEFIKHAEAPKGGMHTYIYNREYASKK